MVTNLIMMPRVNAAPPQLLHIEAATSLHAIARFSIWREFMLWTKGREAILWIGGARISIGGGVIGPHHRLNLTSLLYREARQQWQHDQAKRS